MNAKKLRKMVVPVVCLVCVLAGYVRADKLALQALDLKRTQQADEEASRKRLGGEKE